jgi:hypothetical protein
MQNQHVSKAFDVEEAAQGQPWAPDPAAEPEPITMKSKSRLESMGCISAMVLATRA